MCYEALLKRRIISILLLPIAVLEIEQSQKVTLLYHLYIQEHLVPFYCTCVSTSIPSTCYVVAIDDDSSGSIVWDNKAIDQLLDRTQEGDSEKPQQDWFANEYLSSFKVMKVISIWQ